MADTGQCFGYHAMPMPEIIKASRKRRIATGSGVQVQEVNRMLAQYEQMRTDGQKTQGGVWLK